MKTETETEIETFLKKYHACPNGADFARKYASPADAWDACNRSDWMLWTLNQLAIGTEIQMRQFACWCVRYTPLPEGGKVWDLLTDERSRKVVEVAEAFCEGKATQAELDDAQAAAVAAAAAYAVYAAAAYAAAAYAADAAAAAADAAAEAAWAAAAYTATYAAEAAAWADANVDVDAARAAQADQLRKIFGNPFKK
jgi:hypothetical protein